jgi:hypothetical protein
VRCRKVNTGHNHTPHPPRRGYQPPPKPTISNDTKAFNSEVANFLAPIVLSIISLISPGLLYNRLLLVPFLRIQ